MKEAIKGQYLLKQKILELKRLILKGWPSKGDGFSSDLMAHQGIFIQSSCNFKVVGCTFTKTTQQGVLVTSDVNLCSHNDTSGVVITSIK